MKQVSTPQGRQEDLRIDAVGEALAIRLSQGIDELPHHVCERLKAARNRAVSRRRLRVNEKQVASRPFLLSSDGVTASRSGDEDRGWSWRWMAALPMLALLGGLLVINVVQSDNRDAELAEVDTALLLDDLPPAAYADPGFVQFLKSSREHKQ